MKFRSNAGGLLASTIVLTVGLMWVALIAILADPDELLIPLAVVAAAVVLILLFIWLLRDRPAYTLRDTFSWLSRRRGDDAPEYEPRLIKSESSRYGTNRPPTADQIRDLKDTGRNWVPSNSPARRRSLRRK